MVQVQCHYQPSERAYEGTPEELDYGAMESRLVNSKKGTISYQDQLIYLSSTLGGWNVGVSPQENGVVEVSFANLLLGHFDPQRTSFSSTAPRSFGRFRYAPSTKGSRRTAREHRETM